MDANDANRPRDAAQAMRRLSDQQCRARRRDWSGLVEEQIRLAQEQGLFDNLPGAGKPLNIDENPLAGTRKLAFSMLRANGMSPREIELGREIDADLIEADKLISTLRRQHGELVARLRTPLASERRAFGVLRSKVEEQYAQALRAIYRKILTLNILAPAALHRPQIDVEARLRAFRAEFPTVLTTEAK